MGTSPRWPLGRATMRLVALVELMSRHGEGVLKAVGHHEGAGFVDIALFHDEFDDRVRGYRIESAGRRVIEQHLGLGNDGASDGYAPSHATREFRRKTCRRFVPIPQIAVPRGTRRSISSRGNPLFHQAESNIFRILSVSRRGALSLEHDTHAPAQFEQVPVLTCS